MNQISRLSIILILLLVSHFVYAQITIKGTVTDDNGEPMFGVIVHVDGITESFTTDDQGSYKIVGLKPGSKNFTFFQPGYKKVERTIDPKSGTHRLDVQLAPLSKDLEGVVISGKKEDLEVMTTLRPVEGTAIYAGKKTEVIQMNNITANLSSNRARQIFAQVAGLNIWESDCAGIQIGVGGRGLSPSRNENFNTRQNGYDIAADALGYPESYYSPPMQSIERVEVVRGAASLQYGPQFGGMINFVMKEGTKDRKFESESIQSIGSYGFFNSYNAVGGTIGRFNYYSFFQYKLGKCWRCNSDFDNYTAYAGLRYTSKNGTSVKMEYTRMWYLVQQAGGLTDAQFNQDPQAAYRDRNWFRVKWNVMALSLQHEFSSTAKLDVRLFGLIASREALGFQGTPNQSDPINNPGSSAIQKFRNLILGNFNNIGGEFRFLKRYQIKEQPQIFLTGVRLYKGFTQSKQGAADSTDGHIFEFVDVVANGSSSSYPSGNVAWFAENIFNLHKKLSITPGVRIEFIDTKATGESRTVYRDQADNVILDSLRTGDTRRQRWFPLFGVGLSYKPLKGMELYSNFSQNYKPINFNDLWVSNPSYRIDPNMKDETGFNADLGLRGRIKNAFQFDVTGFLMMYNDRIGYIQQVDPELFSVYRLRTNVSNARTVGIESYLRWNAVETFLHNSDWKLGIFSNVTWLDARYVSSDESAFRNNRVELTPSFLVRAGLDLGWKDIKLSYLYSYTAKQFTDATNSVQTSNAVNGVVPSYYVMDINMTYKIWKFNFGAGVENLTNNMYFTRRATGYPGPGIIPSSGRTFYLTVGIKV
ncbi:MAG: TonB-dependent receptor [Flavobacteriales bacterium]|nr:TonB-dependent receptor [Flavobacteriales bacterium]